MGVRIDKLMLARVVQFSETRYDRQGMFREFLKDELRPVILEDGLAVDIFNHRIYDIVQMEDGIMSLEELASLDCESLYAYTIYNAEFPEQNEEDLKAKTDETIEWYYRECKGQVGDGEPKIVSFEFNKRKLKERGKLKSQTRKS